MHFQSPPHPLAPQGTAPQASNSGVHLTLVGNFSRRLHIKTLERPKPEPVASHHLLARSRNLPGGRGGQGLDKATSGVSAFRDHRGCLIVRNRDTEPKVGEGSHQERVMAQVAPIIQEASLLYGLPVTLIQTLIKVESNFVLEAISPKGAMGLMQLMPETAASLGVQDPFNPRENIHGGCRYLRLMVDHFGGSLPLALAAYNAGPQRVVSCDFQIPPIKKTQNFVTKVLERYSLLTNQGI